MARDLYCSIGLLAVAAWYYYAASGIGRSALSDEIGANGLPMAYALALASIGLLMAVQAILRRILRRAQAKPKIEFSGLVFMLRRAGGVLGIGIGYLLIVTTVGYVIGLIMVLAAMLVYLGERLSAQVALISIGGACFFWVLFEYFLGISMPGLWGL